MKICPIILSGGSGKRLWPLSRKLLPKQFLELNSDSSLIVETTQRITNSKLETLPPIIVCNEDHQFLVSNQLNEANCFYQNIILEPSGKNTAPATTLAAIALDKAYPNEDCLMLVMPADHSINDIKSFTSTIESCQNAVQDSLCIFGVKPTSPSQAYGYIKVKKSDKKESQEILAFHEKPDEIKAKKYLASKSYYWNSGIFLFKKSLFLEAINKTDSEIFEACKLSMKDHETINQTIRPQPDAFNACPANSLDYALMERSFENNIKVKMTPLLSDWSDLGTWNNLFENKPKDINKNVIQGDVELEETSNSYVYTDSGLVTTFGLDNVLVVKTEDAVLVSTLDKSDKLAQLVDKLEIKGREEVDIHKKVHRPWGTYQTVTEDKKSKVKRITVFPHSKLSLQLHHKRAEHWYVLQGEATVIKGNDEVILQANESININLGEKHSLENKQDSILEIIEVQIGDYLGEDDIVRFEDKYGRVDN